MGLSKFLERIELIPYGSIVSVLYVVRPLPALAPLLEAASSEAEEACSSDLVEDGILIIGGQWLGLQPEKGFRQFATLGLVDGCRT